MLLRLLYLIACVCEHVDVADDAPPAALNPTGGDR